MSIAFFDELTDALSEEEKKFIPYIIKGLEKKTGPTLAVKTDDICAGLNALNQAKSLADCKMTPARLRKCINHIRRSGMLNFIIGTSQGYYVTRERAIVKKEIDSLQQRADAIQAVAESMKQHLHSLHSVSQTSMPL